MNLNKIFAFTVLLFIFCIFHISCKKCNGCADEKLVTVPKNVISTPHSQWEMSQSVQHSNGTLTSSISIVPEGITLINSSAADSVTTNIYLTATDSIAGIKCIKLSGGFGYTCVNNANQAIVLDGILAKKSQCLDLTTCCLRSQRIVYEDLGQYIQCQPGRTLTNGGIGLTAIIENCVGQVDTQFITIQF